jgi:hypothetical protein
MSGRIAGDFRDRLSPIPSGNAWLPKPVPRRFPSGRGAARREMGEKTPENEQLDRLSPAFSVEMERLALRQG